MVAGGFLKGVLEHEFPVTIGRDFAGVVERVGADVSRFAPGDEVLGLLTSLVLHDGSFADYVTAAEDGLVAHKPATLGWEQAAGIPLAGLTAHAAVDAAAPSADDVVLVVGAMGGVGSFAASLQLVDA
jgi:NADPH:quinone reductase-like Zn-dependent oxidoreductase